MLAPALLPPVRRLPAIECRPVSDDAMRRVFAEITAVSFDIPATVAEAVYVPERAWRGDYHGFVGLAGNRPVAIAALVSTPAALGVYSVATVPAFRRQGYGEALFRAAAGTAERTPLVLQSTEAGYALYRRMGFRDVTKFTVYLTK